MLETSTLKDDFTFLVSDKTGAVESGPEGTGLYFQDTRYLSQLELSVNLQKPQARLVFTLITILPPLFTSVFLLRLSFQR